MTEIGLRTHVRAAVNTWRRRHSVFTGGRTGHDLRRTESACGARPFSEDLLDRRFDQPVASKFGSDERNGGGHGRSERSPAPAHIDEADHPPRPMSDAGVVDSSVDDRLVRA